MPTSNPMANFNRSNPFVIQAKQEYSNLMLDYHGLMKLLIYFGAFMIIPILSCLFGWQMSKQSCVKFIIFTVIVVIQTAVIIYCTIKFTIGDKRNKSIDKIVSMEMSDVATLNLEQVNDMLHEIHHLAGMVEQARNIVIGLSIGIASIYTGFGTLIYM